MARNYTRESEPAQEPRTPAFVAWHVEERGEGSFWTRIGAAWDHKDGKGLTLQLDLVPTSGGRITLREPKPADKLNDQEAGA